MNRIGPVHVRIGLWFTVIAAAVVWLGGSPRGSDHQMYGQDPAPAAPAAEAPPAVAPAPVAPAPTAPAPVAPVPAPAAPAPAAPAEAAPVQPVGQAPSAAAPASGTSPAKQSIGELMMTSITSSGFLGTLFYVVLAIFSVVAMTVAFERLFRLTRNKVVPPAFVAGLKNLVREKKDTVDNFRMLCRASPSPAARVLEAGILRAGRPLLEVEKSMEDAMAREAADLRSRTRPLDEIANVATLVGLLGTVVGMIFAFRVSSQAGLGQGELLAEGIYLALLTTAIGLTIAVPCMLLFAWFNLRGDRYLRELDTALLDALPCFTSLENSRPEGSGTVDHRFPAAVDNTRPVAASVGGGL